MGRKVNILLFHTHTPTHTHQSHSILPVLPALDTVFSCLHFPIVMDTSSMAISPSKLAPRIPSKTICLAKTDRNRQVMYEHVQKNTAWDILDKSELNDFAWTNDKLLILLLPKSSDSDILDCIIIYSKFSRLNKPIFSTKWSIAVQWLQHDLKALTFLVILMLLHLLYKGDGKTQAKTLMKLKWEQFNYITNWRLLLEIWGLINCWSLHHHAVPSDDYQQALTLIN